MFHPGSSLGLRRQACPLPWAGAESQRPRVQALASSTCGGSLPWKWVFAGVVKLGGGRGGRVDPDPDACPSEKRGSGTGGGWFLMTEAEVARCFWRQGAPGILGATGSRRGAWDGGTSCADCGLPSWEGSVSALMSPVARGMWLCHRGPLGKDAWLRPRPAPASANWCPGGLFRTLLHPGGRASQLGVGSGWGHSQEVPSSPARGAPDAHLPTTPAGPSPWPHRQVRARATLAPAQRCPRRPRLLLVGREGGKGPASCPLPRGPSNPARPPKAANIRKDLCPR